MLIGHRLSSLRAHHRDRGRGGRCKVWTARCVRGRCADREDAHDRSLRSRLGDRRAVARRCEAVRGTRALQGPCKVAPTRRWMGAWLGHHLRQSRDPEFHDIHSVSSVHCNRLTFAWYLAHIAACLYPQASLHASPVSSALNGRVWLYSLFNLRPRVNIWRRKEAGSQ